MWCWSRLSADEEAILNMVTDRNVKYSVEAKAKVSLLVRMPKRFLQYMSRR